MILTRHFMSSHHRSSRIGNDANSCAGLDSNPTTLATLSESPDDKSGRLLPGSRNAAQIG